MTTTIIALCLALALAYSAVMLNNAYEKISRLEEKAFEQGRNIYDLRNSGGTHAIIADYGDHINVGVYYLGERSKSEGFKVVKTYRPNDDMEHWMMRQHAEMLCYKINEQF